MDQTRARFRALQASGDEREATDQALQAGEDRPIISGKLLTVLLLVSICVALLGVGYFLWTKGGQGIADALSPSEYNGPTIRVELAPSADLPDWQKLQRAQGDWSWSGDDQQSIGSFGEGAFTVQCDLDKKVVSLTRKGQAEKPIAFTVHTTKETRSMRASQELDAARVNLNADDDLLDKIAFSRGHFGIAVSGLDPVYLPSWPEISRVIEDCR